MSKKKGCFSATILVVDDEKENCKALKGLLSDEGYRVVVAHSPEEATGILVTEKPNLLLLDVWFGKGSWDGVYFLDRVRLSHPFIPIIMISGHATLNLAVSALQKGAYDFLEKPINVDRLLLSVKRALELRHIQCRLATHRDLGTWAWPLPIEAKLKKLAASETRILLVGEKGTGKVRLAKFLHLLSTNHEGPVIVAGSHMLNELDDSAFFGEQAMGRVQKFGFLEHAQGGTVILSNVHNLTPKRQNALAQLFQSGTIKRLGGDQAIPLNIRFIATALPDFIHWPIQSQTDSDKIVPPITETPPAHIDRAFYDRITLASFSLEPLRKNASLISMWINALLQELAQEHDMLAPVFSDNALIHMRAFDWPGNMEQLRNVLQHIMLQERAKIVDTHHLPSEIIQSGAKISNALSLPKNVYSLPLKEARACFEMSYVKAQIAASEGSVTKAAELIGMERSALHRKLKTLSTRSKRSQPL
jgi:two-component system nitrogen regulation response regulator NtrX